LDLKVFLSQYITGSGPVSSTLGIRFMTATTPSKSNHKFKGKKIININRVTVLLFSAGKTCQFVDIKLITIQVCISQTRPSSYLLFVLRLFSLRTNSPLSQFSYNNSLKIDDELRQNKKKTVTSLKFPSHESCKY
jgi:hypothetical protein